MSSIDRAPHTPYIKIVAAAVEADRQWVTDEYQVAPLSTAGLLTAEIHYARREDTGPEALPDGVTLLWDQRRGWRSRPRDSQGPETRLPVPVLASPRALTLLLPELLKGRTTGFTETTDQWHLSEEHRRLIGRRDVIDTLMADGWHHTEDPGQPPNLAKGTVVWRLSGFDDLWWDTDWRDSRLSAPLWVATFNAATPCSVIVAAARDAVARTSLHADRRHGIKEPA
ncbi:hypothetical protein OG705_29985 [Streptomyces sp. NBC_00838]|uniref:hypothetical protein n=1 Tax=Streptomyces sp. NBC_00838 TaxID=2903680 RepID=UPI00386B5814|nr:hypothetical protein OG705_29985 [Streptomyces sp. NBC_00838]